MTSIVCWSSPGLHMRFIHGSYTSWMGEEGYERTCIKLVAGADQERAR